MLYFLGFSIWKSTCFDLLFALLELILDYKVTIFLIFVVISSVGFTG